LSQKNSRVFGFVRTMRKDQGTSLLELALLLPILILLLLGIIELGRYSEAAIVVANAARAGAQYGAQSPQTAGDAGGISQAAIADAGNTSALLTPLIGLQVTNTPVCGCVGSTPDQATCTNPPTNYCRLLVYVQVDTSGTFQTLFPYPGIPPLRTLSATYEERVGQ
jgi:Flp pilus assembly protein TadG